MTCRSNAHSDLQYILVFCEHRAWLLVLIRVRRL